MNLFNMLPSEFFNPLASNANNRIYAACLIEIYGYFDESLDFRVEQDELITFLSDYLYKNHMILSGEESEDKPDYRAMARSVVSKMSKDEVGWLQKEVDEITFRDTVLMTQMGIKLADFFTRLTIEEDESYDSFVFDISSTLENEDCWADRPYKNGLIPVHKKAMDLKRILGTLNTHLEKYITDMRHKQNLDQIVDNIIDFFSSPFLDDYRNLKDNETIRNRENILARIDERCESEDAFDSLVDNCCREELYDNSEAGREKAKDAVMKKINDIKQMLALDGIYDRIISRIQRKLLQYHEIMASQLKFKRAYGENVQQLIEKAVLVMNQHEDFITLGGKEMLPDCVNDMFVLYDNEYCDEGSIYQARERHIITNPASVEVENIAEEKIRESAKSVFTSNYDPYNKARISAYVKDRINENGGSFTLESLGIKTKEDVLTGVAIAAHASKEYDVEVLDNYVTKDGYVRPMVIVSQRKGAEQ